MGHVRCIDPAQKFSIFLWDVTWINARFSAVAYFYFTIKNIKSGEYGIWVKPRALPVLEKHGRVNFKFLRTEAHTENVSGNYFDKLYELFVLQNKEKERKAAISVRLIDSEKYEELW